MRDSFDVIITTRKNAEKHNSIIFTIRTVLNQSLQPNSIIVVENNNYLKTKELISKEFGELVVVVDGSLHDRNISYCRNLGVKNSLGNVVIFMDDDVLLHRYDVFSKIIHCMKYYDFMCGAKRLWSPINWFKIIDKDFHISHILNILKCKSFEPKSINRISGKLSFHNFTFIGNLGAIRREVFNEIGGFDESYEGWGYQDTDLMMRLCYNGYNYELMCNLDIIVYHLSHGVNKSQDFPLNRQKYYSKQKEIGKKFILSHFFGIFPDDDCSLFTLRED